MTGYRKHTGVDHFLLSASPQVDIDIKLRSCKGSCARHSQHQVDLESFVALDKQVSSRADRPAPAAPPPLRPTQPHLPRPLDSQVQQLESQRAQSVETAGSLFVMKSKPLREALVDTRFKSGDTPATAGQQTEDLFPEVSSFRLCLAAVFHSVSVPASHHGQTDFLYLVTKFDLDFTSFEG